MKKDRLKREEIKDEKKIGRIGERIKKIFL